MRTFFRYLLLALVLIVVALMSALTAMRVAIHGREVSVPNFVKLTANEAEKLAVDSGLLMEVEGKFYSADVPEGQIMSQQPAPGARVRRGWRVQLAESLGPQRAAIPDLVGQSRRAAELNIRQRGLELGTVAHVNLPGFAPEQVVAQDPPANSQAASPRIDLLVTGNEPGAAWVMPNFVGRQLGEASADIARAGLKLREVRTAPPISASSEGAAATATNDARPQAKQTIAAQKPAAGQRVSAGMTVEFTVRP